MPVVVIGNERRPIGQRARALALDRAVAIFGTAARRRIGEIQFRLVEDQRAIEQELDRGAFGQDYIGAAG